MAEGSLTRDARCPCHLGRGLGLLSVIVALSTACQGARPDAAEVKAPAEFTAPIGIELPASGELPALTLVLTFTRGATIEGLVEPVGSALYKALKACPEVVQGIAAGQSAVVPFTIDGGRISSTRTYVGGTPTTCLSAALAGDRIATPPGMTLAVQARIQRSHAQHRTP